MNRLFIAEKRDIATAMADFLWPDGYTKEKHYYHNGDNSDCVTWASGHILRLALPEEYDEWVNKRAYYPLFPKEWKHLPYEKSVEQLKAIKELLKQYSVVVNGGDADREGQLLVDEILNYYNYKGQRLRIFITAKDDTSMKRAFDKIEDDEKYHSLYMAGVVRAESDWLVGMNTSRAYNAEARRSGYPVYGDFRFRIGRVKMPTLALVVLRELLIRNFKSHNYYVLNSMFRKDGISFKTTLVQTAEMQPQDSDGRILERNVLTDIASELEHVNGVVSDINMVEKTKSAPLPHSLDTLQILANKQFGLSPNDTLSIVQQLYQKKFVTYPRSDCNYLPVSQQADAPVILKNLSNCGISGLFNAAELADASIVSSKCWNDKKVTVHTALIPTMEPVKATDLSQDEKDIYYLIGLFYVMQFFPKHKYMETTFKISCGKYTFKGSGRKVLEPGYKKVFSDSNDDDKTDNRNGELPVLAKGDSVGVGQFTFKEGKTTSPVRFTLGTLIDAMANIWKFMDKDNPNREMIKEVKGIGTPATRATIVDDLLATSIKGRPVRPYLEKKGKYLYPTEFGIFTIQHIHESLAKPDLTALIEYKLSKIVDDESVVDSVREDIKNIVLDNIKYADTNLFPPSEGAVKCPICHKSYLTRHEKDSHVYYVCPDRDCVSPVTKKRLFYSEHDGKPVVCFCKKCNHPLSLSKSGKFFMCTACKTIYINENMGPGEETVITVPKRTEDSVDCPVCHTGFLVPAKGKEGDEYFYCSNRDCNIGGKRLYYASDNGKPVIVPCPICGKPLSYSNKSHSFKCVSCDRWFDAKGYDLDIRECPACGKILHHFKRKSDGKWAFHCPDCGKWFDDVDGNPVESVPRSNSTGGYKTPERTSDSVDCPVCKKGYLYRCKAKQGFYFWSCSNKECTHNGKHTMLSDYKGKPLIVACPKCKATLNYWGKSHTFSCPSCRTWYDEVNGKAVPQKNKPKKD